MVENLLVRIARHPLSAFLTPFVERFVYHLIYPGVVGASLVEAAENLHNGLPSFRWILLLALFMLDYALTGGEATDKPPKGNILIAAADLLAATFFAGTYFVVQRESADLSDHQLGQLLVVLIGLNVALVLWYVARWSTRELAAVDAGSTVTYEELLRANRRILWVQICALVPFGIALLTGCLNLKWTFDATLVITILGLLIRNVKEYRSAYWRQSRGIEV